MESYRREYPRHHELIYQDYRRLYQPSLTTSYHLSTPFTVMLLDTTTDVTLS